MTSGSGVGQRGSGVHVGIHVGVTEGVNVGAMVGTVVGEGVRVGTMGDGVNVGGAMYPNGVAVGSGKGTGGTWKLVMMLLAPVSQRSRPDLAPVFPANGRNDCDSCC